MPWTDADVARVAQAQTAEWKRLRDMLRQYDCDEERERRQAMRLCGRCYYLRRPVVGRALTDYTCSRCGRQCAHPDTPDTGFPALCPACADARGLCMRCGGPREAPPGR